MGDQYVRRHRLALARGYSVIQIAALLIVGSILGDLLRKGSVHLSPVYYADLTSELLNSWPGILVLFLTIGLATLLFPNGSLVGQNSVFFGRASGVRRRAHRWRQYRPIFARALSWSKSHWPFRGRANTANAEEAWVTVRRLTAEAQHYFAVGDYGRSEALVGQAMTINRDRQKVPDPKAVGAGYLLMVTLLLKRRDVKEAGRLAFEGYQRRKCASTISALARFYADQNSPLAARFERDSLTCSDRD